ncbi:unnamed protein product [Pieris macdunnoughi]|uniref:acid phosphatase n=2 Tax=Pieris macdunnoughi TaxID=345717 RepID=A0A821L992_9NEOP|nr:unnamed protein product [Pieris macdunnoughi]
MVNNLPRQTMFKCLPFLCLIIHYSTCNEYKLRYAAVIYRHGDRTPVDTYPTDPWGEESFWPVKFGQLTNIGKMQHYKLGQWLRQRYVNFITDEFDPEAVYVRSTDVDRTLMSAQANLAGMYPPDVNSTWNPKLFWQPIPVHTEPEVNDEILAMKKECKMYEKLKKVYLNSEVYKNRLRQYEDLMDYLTKYTGRKIRDYEDISSIYSTLKIEALYNFTLPNWTHAVFPDKMKSPACYSFTTATATPAMTRFMIGPLVKHILKQALSVILGDSKLRLSMYSGHDFTIGNVLNGLSVYNGNCPEYTSTILFEFIEKESEYYIQLSYRNSTEIVEPHVLNIPNCGELCPLQHFIQLYEDIIVVDWETECEEKYGWLLFFCGIISLSFLYTIVEAVKFYKKKDQYSEEYLKSKLLLNRL